MRQQPFNHSSEASVQTLPLPTALTVLLSASLAVFSGCDSLTTPSLVGKWQADGGNTLEFFPDGTLQDVAALNTSDGTYVVLDGNRLKTEIEGVLWGTNVNTWTYQIDGDVLTLTSEGGVGITMKFKRIR